MNRQLKCTPIEQDNANSNLRQVVSRNTHKWCFNWLLPMVSTFGACSLKSSASIWRGVVFVVLVVGLMVTMFQNVFAYDTEWKWANRDETFQWSVVHSAAIAPNGDSIYVTTLNTGIHIAKYNTADGNKLWDKIVSETNTVKGIAVDNDENIYITGSISSSTSFDGKLVILKGWNDVFIAKYNSNGVLQWVKTAGGAGRDSGESIAVDSFGNPYIVGYVSQGGCFENNCPTELDDQSLFVAKYSTNGDLIWVQQVVEGRVEESSADIVVDASNNVYITVGVYEKDGKPFPNIVGKIVYIAKYDSDGQKKWDDGIYSPNGDESVGGIAVNQDAVYVTGYFTQKVCLVSNGSCYDGDSSGYFDVFLAKYKPNGTSANLENFEVFGSAFTNLQVHDVAINSLGEPIIVGDFTGTLIGINTVSSEGKDDIFVATLIDNEWTLQRVGGKNSDSGQVVTINHTTGDIYVAGQLGDGDFTFPPLSFTDSSPQAVPSMFVGKISLIPSITGTVLNDDTDPKIGLHKWTVKLKSVDNENNIFSTETEEGVYTFKDSYPLETYLLYIVPPEEGWEHRFPENGLGIYTINLEESVVFEDQDFRYGSSAVINIPDNEYLCINGKSNGIGYSWRLENSSIYQNPDAEGIASGDSIDLAKDFVFKEFPDQGIFVNGYENNCFAIDGTLCVASKGTVITPNCEEAEINGDACIVGKAGCTYNPTIRLIKSSLDTTLSVSQTSHDVDGTSNTITIDVAKIGSGSIMGWVAEADDSWLTIESGEYGENNGTITVRYDANSTEERTGTITVVAPGAENGSQTVTVKQASPSLVTVNGTIWIDTNTTGIKDDGDSKADAYWYTEYVHLTNLDSQQVFSAMMFVDYIDDYDYFGNWMTIDKIPAGDYKIEVQLPTNWVQLTPASDDIVHIDDSTGAINIGMQPPITVGFGIDGEISINDVEPNSLCKRPSSYFRLQPSGKESVMSYSISSQIIDGLTFQTLGFAGTVQVQNNIPSVTISPNNEVQNILLNGNTISFDIPMTFNESADSVDTGNIYINFAVTNETGYSTRIITCGHVPDTPLQELYAGSDMEVKVGETVDFQGIVYDPDTNDHYEVSWYFEDTGEEVKDTLTPTHVYTTPGTYEVSLFAEIDKVDKYHFGEDILIVTVVEAESVFDLTISKTGNGTISANGINCGSDCSESYTENTQVTLTDSPDNGYKFVNWTGSCTGTETCQVVMDKAKNVTANFELEVIGQCTQASAFIAQRNLLNIAGKQHEHANNVAYFADSLDKFLGEITLEDAFYTYAQTSVTNDTFQLTATSKNSNGTWTINQNNKLVTNTQCTDITPDLGKGQIGSIISAFKTEIANYYSDIGQWPPSIEEDLNYIKQIIIDFADISFISEDGFSLQIMFHSNYEGTHPDIVGKTVRIDFEISDNEMVILHCGAGNPNGVADKFLPEGCNYTGGEVCQANLSVTPIVQDVLSEASTISVNVGTNECPINWTAQTDADWLTIINTSGTNDGTITVSYTTNSGDARTGTITVTADGAENSPQTIEVKQEIFNEIVIGQCTKAFTAQLNLLSIAEAQRTYYLEDGYFADSLDILDGFNLEDTFYIYTLTTVDTNSFLATATSKNGIDVWTINQNRQLINTTIGTECTEITPVLGKNQVSENINGLINAIEVYYQEFDEWPSVDGEFFKELITDNKYVADIAIISDDNYSLQVTIDSKEFIHPNIISKTIRLVFNTEGSLLFCGSGYPNGVASEFLPENCQHIFDFTVENSIPNNGDGNGDNILDSLQANVTSLPSVVTGDYISLETTDSNCPVQAVKSKSENDAGNGQDDPIGTYPQGLLEFDIPCQTADIKVFYHGVPANSANNTINIGGIDYSINLLGYRKFGPNPPGSSTEEWYTLEPKNGFVPNLQFGTATIGGNTILTASFTLQDGELGDDTGVDGVIYDIGGFANLPPVTYYSVNSQVLDAQGNPIAGATIQIADKTVITNENGNWEITGLVEGNYTATISKDGYTFESTDFNVADSNVELEVIGQPDVIYAIQGTIQDDLNNPISNVTLQIGDKTVTTDTLGNWEIQGLQEGAYTITAAKDGLAFMPLDFEVGNNQLWTKLRLKPLTQLKVRITPKTRGKKAEQGKNLVYRIDVTNGGDQAATGGTIIYQIPAGTTLVKLNGIGKVTCEATVETVTCTIPDLKVGATAKIDIVLDIGVTAATLLNVVTLNSNEYPVDIAKNWTKAKPYLSVFGKATPSPVTMGSQLHYSFAVELNDNAPNGKAEANILTITLPKGLTLETAPANCDTSNLPEISCPIESLSVETPEDTSKVTINLDVLVEEMGLIKLITKAEISSDSYAAHASKVNVEVNTYGIEVDGIIVMDVTKSMGDQLKAITRQVKQRLVDGFANGAKPFVAVVTFRDEDDIKLVAATRNLEILLEAVESLEAKDGGMCPEASADALLLGLNHLKQKGTIIFVTDAPPYDNAETQATLEQIKQLLVDKEINSIPIMTEVNCDGGN